MSMKITKKILAGTLALMSTFTAVSAAPVKIEKSPVVPTSENNKNPEGKSTKKELAKVAGIVGGAAAAVAAVGGAIVLFREIFKTQNIKVPLGTSRKILECYMVSRDPNSKINELLEKYKETELVKALMDLFIALDVNGLVNKECVIRSLKCVDSYIGIFGHETGCIELRQFFKEGLDKEIERCTIKSPVSGNILSSIDNMIVEKNMLSVYVDSNVDFSKLRYEEINTCKTLHADYNLKAVYICDEENFLSTIVCVEIGGKWYMLSLCGNNEELSTGDSILFLLKNYRGRGKVNLFYVKSNKPISWKSL